MNHKLVPLSHKLKSGDQVEILTSKSQHVQPSWISFVSTAKAKAKIQAILRRDGREVQKQGEEALANFLQGHDLTPSDALADQLAAFHDKEGREAFYQALGEKTIILGNKDLDELNGKNKKEKKQSKGWRKYVPFLSSGKEKKEEATPQKELFVVPDKFNRKQAIYITDDNISQYKFMHCCHPIPGDDVLGFIDNKKCIEIHRRSCPVAAKLKSSYGNRILDAKWTMGRKLFFDATIQLTGIDRIGLLNQVTQVISNQLNVNIRSVNIRCDEGIFDGHFDLRVHDRADVKTIMDNLRKIEGIQEVIEIM